MQIIYGNLILTFEPQSTQGEAKNVNIDLNIKLLAIFAKTLRTSRLSFLIMTVHTLKERNIEYEFSFSASRSSGPGGQNVNKVSTRVEIRFNVLRSSVLDLPEKELISARLIKKITSDGELLTFSQSERSQLRNKENAIEKMLSVIARALTVKPVRKPTEPTVRSKDKRLEKKRKHGSIKALRKGMGDDLD
jgi:ribosome-associated protein